MNLGQGKEFEDHQTARGFCLYKPADFGADLFWSSTGMQLNPGIGLVVGEIVICPADGIKILIGNENIELERRIPGDVL